MYIILQGVIRTNDDATSTFVNSIVAGSRVVNVATVDSGSLSANNILIEDNIRFESGFYATSAGASMRLNNLTYRRNSNDRDPWIGVYADGGSNVIVLRTTFEENQHMIWGILSETSGARETRVTARDLRFEGNTDFVSKCCANGGLAPLAVAFPLIACLTITSL